MFRKILLTILIRVGLYGVVHASVTSYISFVLKLE